MKPDKMSQAFYDTLIAFEDADLLEMMTDIEEMYKKSDPQWTIYEACQGELYKRRLGNNSEKH